MGEGRRFFSQHVLLSHSVCALSLSLPLCCQNKIQSEALTTPQRIPGLQLFTNPGATPPITNSSSIPGSPCLLPPMMILQFDPPRVGTSTAVFCVLIIFLLHVYRLRIQVVPGPGAGLRKMHRLSPHHLPGIYRYI